MHITIVHVRVKPEYIDDFIEASIANHEGSVREAGNHRFDVLQSKDDPAVFAFYEAFESEADVKAHKDTSHYATWRESVEHMMAEPRRGVPYQILAPKA